MQFWVEMGKSWSGCWSKDPIRKPMLPLEDKTLKKEACDLFKLVQIYMGDRKCKPGMTCNSVALELCNHAWNKPSLRDELYLHICRQTTENPRKYVFPLTNNNNTKGM